VGRQRRKWYRTPVRAGTALPSSPPAGLRVAGCLSYALSELAECSRTVPAADTLFHAGDPVKSLYLVVTGALRLTRMLPHGAELIVQRAEPGAIVAEPSLFADRYCCNAIATETSLLHVVRIQAVRAALREDSVLLWEWVRHMARELQQARARAEILSLKTVAHRIEGWRALNNGVLPPKGRWRQLADEIGVSPEALYREFARRG
jgi:CRP/FNR family transcriptional regulator, dissimilatory nitrate respiration regulator